MKECFVSCIRGSEPLLAEELNQFGGAKVKPQQGGVLAHLDDQAIYKAIMFSRLANRLRLKVGEAHVESKEQLVEWITKIPWEHHLDPKTPIWISSHLVHTFLNHTRYTSQLVKDGIVDRMRMQTGTRPDVSQELEHLQIHLHSLNKQSSVYLELGGNLSRRGYRSKSGAAPIAETLAATLLMRAGWPNNPGFYDPFCGTGTLVIEAAMMQLAMAPGLVNDAEKSLRCWRGFDESKWRQIKQQAESIFEEKKSQHQGWRAIGTDADPKAIEASQINAQQCGLRDFTKFEQKDIFAGLPLQVDTTLVTNPPYGERLGDLPLALALHAELGNQLSKSKKLWVLGLITPEESLGRATGFRSRGRWKLKNGPIDCQFLQFFAQEQSQRPLSEPVLALINRLKKVAKIKRKWAQKNEIEAYRVYDADLPEFNASIDLYGDHMVIQEHRAPKEIPIAKVEMRRRDLLLHAPATLGIDPQKTSFKTRERQKGADQYQRMGQTEHRLWIREGKAELLCNLYDYLDTGLFLDTRNVRLWIHEQAQGKSFLNLFCYSGTATVHAALGGAKSSDSVDLSKAALNRAEENLKHNGLDIRRHVLIREDVTQWLKTCRQTYDLIYLDPPTFSNSKSMKGDFSVQRDQEWLLGQCLNRLSPGGQLLFVNNFRQFKWESALPARANSQEVTQRFTPEDFAGKMPSRIWLINQT